MTNELKTGSFGTAPSAPQFGVRAVRPNVDAMTATPAVRPNVDAMTAAPAVRPGVVDKPDTIRRKDIHDKWNKISDTEANAFTGMSDLVAMIHARYGTSKEQAQLDVDAWAKNRVF
jgi:hypothetical protein